MAANAVGTAVQAAAAARLAHGRRGPSGPRQDALRPHPVARPQRRLVPVPSAPARPAAQPQADAADLTCRYLDEIAALPLLDPAAEAVLARRARRGDRAARETLVVHNLRLVVFVARRYQGRGLPLLDLVSEGNVGLMHAVERFDPERGARLSTYAIWWIREHIELALIRQGHAIRLPVHVAKDLRRCLRAGRRLAADGGTAAGAGSIANACGRDQEEIRRLLQYAEAPVSMDAGMYAEEGIADPAQVEPAEAVQRAEVAGALARWLRQLPERQRIVLERRFGLGGAEEATLGELALALGITAERVRQLQNDALARMAACIAREGVDPRALL